MVIFHSFQCNYNEWSVTMTCMWFSWLQKRYLLNCRVTNWINRTVSRTPLHVWTEEVLSDWHNPRPSSAQPRLEAPAVVVAREVELARMIAEGRVKSKDARRNDGGEPDKAHKCIIVLFHLLCTKIYSVFYIWSPYINSWVKKNLPHL